MAQIFFFLLVLINFSFTNNIVDPPFIESFSRHFTMKALKKIMMQGADKKKVTGPGSGKGGSPKKLSREEKEILVEAFKLNDTKKSPGKSLQTSVVSRNRSPPRFERLSEEAK